MTINLFRIKLFSYSRVKNIGMTNTVPFYSPSKNVRKKIDRVWLLMMCMKSLSVAIQTKAAEYCLLLARRAIFYLEVQTLGYFDGKS